MGPCPTRDRRRGRSAALGMRSAIASTSLSPIEPTATTTDTAMHRSPGRAVAGRDRCVRGHVDVGIGQHDHVVLRSAERLHPLAVARTGLVHVAGDRRGADEGHRRDVRVLEDRGPPPPCRRARRSTRRPERRPRAARSAISNDADGSFSDGFSTKVLPVAIAFDSIHSGTIAGKLNGVMPATTPSGCRIE